jgi:hypothetical protein
MRQICIALIKWGKFDVKIIPMRWGGCPNTALDGDEEPTNALIRAAIVNSNITSKPELFIQVSIPNEFQPQGKFNIGITAGIESTLPRVEWLEGLNRMDFNIVPSKFAKEVFVKASFNRSHPDGRQEHIKLEKPMEVAFEGVNTEIFKKTQKPSPALDTMMDSIPETFCFLMVGHWLQGEMGADRKDIGMLIKVFSEVFKNKKNAPALILKTSGATFSQMDKDEILKKINLARVGLEGTLPNVYLVHGDLSLEEMNRLYNHPKVKVNVSFTHGEGFGRPLLEATLSGKPTIAPGWSGQLDFLPKNLAILLPGSLGAIPQSAVNDWLVKESSWYNVNYSVAAGKMNDVFENYINYIPNAEKLRVENSEIFTLEAGNKLLVEIIDKNLPVFEKKVQLVLPKFKKIEKV